MDLKQTQIAIKYIKDIFESTLSKKLHLLRVSAPLFVLTKSGLNDELNGVEERIKFLVKEEELEIVQSLAKWKRFALKEYDISLNEGIYTDMNAIRKDETLDNLHSIYVDQWDWEIHISEKQRNLRYLFSIVRKIYGVIYSLANRLEKKYGFSYDLSKKITFISSQKLESLYPNNSTKEREYLICKEYKAVFIYQIGWPLKNKTPHDGRAADYDDWKLNGDIILYDETLDCPLEISSMGIRVNKDSLIKQLRYKNELYKLDNPYCQKIMNDELPLSIGGGIGQSRLCLYYLNKRHIGEVQSSYWPEDMKKELKDAGIDIL